MTRLEQAMDELVKAYIEEGNVWEEYQSASYGDKENAAARMATASKRRMDAVEAWEKAREEET